MNKIFKFSLGTVGIVAPIATIVSCKELDELAKYAKVAKILEVEANKISVNSSVVAGLTKDNFKDPIKAWLKKQDSYKNGDKLYKKSIDDLEIIKIDSSNVLDKALEMHLTDRDVSGMEQEVQKTHLTKEAKDWIETVIKNVEKNKLFLVYKVKTSDSAVYVYTDKGITLK